MNLLFKFTSPVIEASYIRAKKTCIPSFLILLTTISVGITIESVFQEGIAPQSVGTIIKMTTVLILCGILWKCGCKIETYKNLILTILSFGLLINEVFRLRELVLPFEASASFHAGYAFGIFERIIIRQLSHIEFRIGFLTATAIARLLLIPLHYDTVVCYYWIWWIIGLLAEVLRERDERTLFKRFYDSKEELIKFKDLMVSSLPTNILILTKDLKRKLFMNEYFLATFQPPKDAFEAEWKVDEWLSRFLIEKEKLNASTRDMLVDEKDSELNMLQVLEKLIEKRLLDDNNHQFCFHMQNKTDEKNDSKRIFETQMFLLPWDGKAAVAVVFNNVTQQYMNLALRVADSNKDRMIAMVSHELRTPLNCILGMISIMEKQIKDSQILTYLTVCKNSGTLLLSLVNSILDLGQIRNNKFKLTISKGNIHEILEEIFLLFEIQFRAKNLDLKIDIMSDVSDSIVSDLNRLKQILINLIANALKFTSEGGVKVLVSKHESLEGYLTFRVSDTGIGIKDEDKKKLFKMYGRLDHTDPKLNSEGVGLGLTISDHLVRLLSGEDSEAGIQVESEHLKGTTFSFSIKCHLKDTSAAEYDLSNTEGREHSRSSDESKEFASRISNYILQSNKFSFSCSSYENKRLLYNPLQKKQPSLRLVFSDTSSNTLQVETFGANASPKTPASFRYKQENYGLLRKSPKKGNVLLVDDNPFNIMVAKHIIESLDYHVETALNGREAINLVKKFAAMKKVFKIILMDCQMPIMNGYEATRLLRKMIVKGEIQNVPIVALSANDTEGDKERCREVGMCEHLAKPLNEKRLIETVEKFCK